MGSDGTCHMNKLVKRYAEDGDWMFEDGYQYCQREEILFSYDLESDTYLRKCYDCYRKIPLDANAPLPFYGDLLSQLYITSKAVILFGDDGAVPDCRSNNIMADFEPMLAALSGDWD